MTAEFTDDGFVVLDVDSLIDELNERDAEAGGTGKAMLSTDDVRRALLGMKRVQRPGLSVPPATIAG